MRPIGHIPLEDENHSRPRAPCFAIRAGERSNRSLYARPSGPEIAEAKGDRIERADADRVVVLCAHNQQPLPIVEFECLEGEVRLHPYIRPLDGVY